MAFVWAISSKMKRAFNPFIETKTVGTFVLISGLVLIAILFKPFGNVVNAESKEWQSFKETHGISIKMPDVPKKATTEEVVIVIDSGDEREDILLDKSSVSLIMPGIPKKATTEEVKMMIGYGENDVSIIMPDTVSNIFYTVSYSEIPRELIKRHGVQTILNSIGYITFANDPYYPQSLEKIRTTLKDVFSRSPEIRTTPIQYEDNQLVKYPGKEFVRMQGYDLGAKARLYLIDNKLYQMTIGLRGGSYRVSSEKGVTKTIMDESLSKDKAEQFFASLDLDIPTAVANTTTVAKQKAVADTTTVAKQKAVADTTTVAKQKTVNKVAGDVKKMTIEELKKTTVYITVKRGKKSESGSGFVIHKSQNTVLIITNAHLVKYQKHRNRQVLVTFNSGESNELIHSADVIGISLSANLALLKVKLSQMIAELPVIQISHEFEVPEMQEVQIFGFPFETALATVQKSPTITVSSGIVTNKSRDENGQIMSLQIDGNLNPGNAGGPIVTPEGVLLGVATAIISKSGIGLAVPARQINMMMAGTLTDVSVTETEKISADTMEITLQATKIDPFHHIKIASCILVPENQASLNKALQADGSWQGITTHDVASSPMFLPDLEKMVTKIPLSSRTSRYYYGQVVLKTSDQKFIYQPPFKLTLNLSDQNNPIEITEPGSLASLSRIPTELKVTEEIIMPSPIEDVILAAGGKYLIVKFKQPQLGIFDIAVGDWAKIINMDDSNFQMAANRNKLLIGLQDKGKLIYYDLETLSHQRTIINRFKIKAMALGWDSDDEPLFIISNVSKESSNRRFFDSPFFLDIDTFKPIHVDWITSEGAFMLINGFNYDYLLRASANGKLFTGWHTNSTPSGIHLIQLKSGTGYSQHEHTNAGYLAPSFDGNMIYTPENGIIDTKLNVIQNLEKMHPIPGTTSLYFLTINNRNKNKNVSLTIHRTRDYQAVLTLDELSEMNHDSSDLKYLYFREPLYYEPRLTEDKRYWLFPDINRLITIPYSNDRLVIREVDLEP
ncbi:hypothetical protein BGP_0199 [Beggiatoa sp. PS]|nr:hypothetical protein BGP_0199 [Beggiatoa sp. PS]